MRLKCACVHVCVCACVRAEGIVDILLDGGALVNVKNRKNQLPRQLTHNMKILNKLSSAVLQTPTTQTHSGTDARNTTVSLIRNMCLCRS